jgi:polysaccharide biosynthesis/export protein
MQMTRSSALLGVWLAMAVLGAAASAQGPVQPPSQNPAQTPPAAPTSPVIIAPPAAVPPSKAADDPSQATPAQKTESKPAAGKGAKNKLDPSAVPAKDPTAVGPAYVIGPEDALYVRVWGNPELSGSVTVGPDGTISLQLIDAVKASGLTPRQLEESLAEKLKKFVTTPEVNIQVMAVRSRTYIILGEGVSHPGIYPLTRPMTVMEALIAGGSFSPFAKKKKIYVLRGTQKFPFNWSDVSKGKNLAQNILVQNGDQIYVP